MGWARTLFLGDIGNRLDIADAEQDIARLRGQLRASRRTNRSLEERVKALEAESEQVELFLLTLLSHFRERKMLSEETIQELVELVDE